ncbi:MAG: hypothetical protein ISS67_01735 [Desulfobacterales bacterium]|uniref:Uncharacterized protein n=1 Tax=Candidatus Desulfaltia bathyphila TaxID=2841697 RepID=A0A8J6N4Z2_9BACT|nr:hypothetical protein [Candidatus Desulfaltia bathyphila]MBL7195875.1 hypothetical protein [Desulfobacterales bacterium]MBL7207234.1 hypothetical protein [Desulfobacterales bacterium]
MIKFKTGNCLNVLEIVKKELGYDIVIYKKSSDCHNCYFGYGLFFLYYILIREFFLV